MALKMRERLNAMPKADALRGTVRRNVRIVEGAERALSDAIACLRRKDDL